MWKSRLFWKLFSTYALLLVLAVGGCVWVVSDWHEQQIVGYLQHQLEETAQLTSESLADEFPTQPNIELQSRLQRLGAGTPTRYTVVDRNGRVLADSDRETLAAVSAMENHLSRKEFVQAQREGIGRSYRNSPTLGTRFFYHALAVRRDGMIVGYVRTAMPVSAVRNQVAEMRQFMLLLGLAIGLLGLAIISWISNRILGPVRVLSEAAAELAKGEFPQHMGASNNDELGALIKSFEQVSRELSKRHDSMRQSLQRQMTVLSGMIEGVIAVDGREHVLFANAAAGRTLKFNPEQVVGRSLLEVVRSHELREIVTETFERQQLCRGEIQWQANSMLTLDVHAAPLPGSPCPGVVLVLHDITELKRLEGLRQQFVANVSHELKTPLSSIKAYTETLLGGALEDAENARRFLARIDEQTDRLHELILDLLSIARIESGQAVLDVADVSLRHVVEMCVADHEARAEAAELQLENEVGDSPLHVRADEEALLQILGNLVDNAIKYTPPGGKVTIRSRTEADQVVLEVVDTGVGIAPEHHERLFERFYRVDKARSRELGGTGLGLAIVKHLCQAMHGSVSVKSSPGKGSLFGVRLPASAT